VIAMLDPPPEKSTIVRIFRRFKKKELVISNARQTIRSY